MNVPLHRAIKRLLLLLPLTVCLLTLQAQTYFNRTYKEDRPLMIFSSIEKADTGYFVMGVTIDKNIFTTYDRVFIGELDENGHMLGYKSFVDSAIKNYGTYHNTLIRSKTGHYIFSGYSGDTVVRLLGGRFSSKFDSIERQEYYTPNTFLFSGMKMLELGDKGYFVAGIKTHLQQNDADAVLVKLDSTGNRLWEKYYNSSKRNYARSIIELKNGNFMLGAFRSNISNTNELANTWLIEVDTGGNMVRQWFDPSDSTYVAQGLQQTDDGGFIYAATKKVFQTVNSVAAHQTIVKLDSNFNKQWVITDGAPSFSTELTDIEKLKDGNYVACGNKPIYNGDSSMVSGWVIKFTDSGQVLWNKTYAAKVGSGFYNYLMDIDELPDGSLIAVGRNQNINYSPSQEGWLLKLDSNGCEIENCLVGIDVPVPVNQVTVYPNPFTNHLAVSLGNINTHEATFVLTDIQGKEVYRLHPTNLATGNATVLDVNRLVAGIYFIQVNANGQIFTTKVVKQ